MARLRTLKPDYYLDEGLSEVSLEAHFLLSGLWTIADRAGRLEDRPRRIKVQVFPYRDVDVDKALGELAASGYVVRYEADGKRLLQVADWERDQRPHFKEPPSQFPAPGGASNDAGAVDVDLVYFVRAKAAGRIKIGYTSNLRARMDMLQTGCPEPLELFGTAIGGRKLERQIHEALAEFRLDGEWFRDTQGVVSYISSLENYTEHRSDPGEFRATSGRAYRSGPLGSGNRDLGIGIVDPSLAGSEARPPVSDNSADELPEADPEDVTEESNGSETPNGSGMTFYGEGPPAGLIRGLNHPAAPESSPRPAAGTPARAPGTARQATNATAPVPTMPERAELRLVSPKAARTRKPSAAERLYAQLEATRKARCEERGVAFVAEDWAPARQNTNLGRFAKLEPAEQERFEAAWAEYLSDDAGAVRNPPWSLGWFLASKSTWESKALRGAS